MKVLAPSHCTG
ncbi:Protein of unknown function [Bacillus cytotoxicus]|nr:Protein of unknown function [Bacillus cytotoxicus]